MMSDAMAVLMYSSVIVFHTYIVYVYMKSDERRSFWPLLGLGIVSLIGPIFLWGVSLSDFFRRKGFSLPSLLGWFVACFSQSWAHSGYFMFVLHQTNGADKVAAVAVTTLYLASEIVFVVMLIWKTVHGTIRFTPTRNDENVLAQGESPEVTE